MDAHDSTKDYLHIQPVVLQYRTKKFLDEANENGLLNDYNPDKFHALMTGEGELNDDDYAWCIASDADGNVDEEAVMEWLKLRKSISENGAED